MPVPVHRETGPDCRPVTAHRAVRGRPGTADARDDLDLRKSARGDLGPADRYLPRPRLAAAPLLRAFRAERPEVAPVWFTRQAGWSLPEYRKLREGIAMLDSCRRPDLVTEITLQPVRRYGVDAAIFYPDIVVPLKAVGVDLDIVPGVGPVIAEPFRTRADLDRIPVPTPEHVPDITEAVGLLVAALGATPLIGFAGAPFTLASYLVERGPSRELALQGNLDPALLSAGPNMLRNRTIQTFDAGMAVPGHVLNLGYGVPTGADPDMLQLVVDTVHDCQPQT